MALLLDLFPQFPYEFTVANTSFNSSSIRHDVHFVDYGLIYNKIDEKGDYALGPCDGRPQTRGLTGLHKTVGDDAVSPSAVYFTVNGYIACLIQ